MTKPTDEQILEAVAYWGGENHTYVIKNVLRMDLKADVSTPWVRRQLERLEKAGKVKRLPTNSGTHIRWGLVEVAKND